jgi:murein DD-endopeptidase MepM/ murein hydrolase activator NlpD
MQRLTLILCALITIFVAGCKTISSSDETAMVATGAGTPETRVPALLGARPRSSDPALVWPAKGELSSTFGWRGRRMHEGIDIRAPIGTPVKSAAPGRVQFVGRKRGYGITIIMRHDGYSTLYAHLNKAFVRIGTELAAGAVMAEVGRTGNATGAHLHFEKILPRGPIDPMPFLQMPQLISSLGQVR